ncbi:MAG: hypothetical protein EA369_02705 [Bradymonadales bacterium]|nr:MAG: hypothetical protein EA369_02705 [Bradymonadales bacterium]
MEKLQALRERLQELFEVTKERLVEFWKPLNPREKMIVGGAVAIFCSALLIFVASQSLQWISRSVAGPRVDISEVEQIRRIVSELGASQMEIRRFERMRAEMGDDFNFREHLETEARRAGLQIRDLQAARPSTPLVGPDEEFYELQLDLQSPLPASLRFLNSLDQTLGIRVVGLRVKPSFADRQRAEVRAEIAYRKVQ